VLYASMACILVYIALGIAVYGFGLEEWGAIKACYFAVVTLTTIGFGDLVPSTEAGKGFTIVFALLGVSLVALSVGEISAYLIEKHDEQVR
jgi:voltage-gated potassium channel Kch